jgi:hypothetical protein
MRRRIVGMRPAGLSEHCGCATRGYSGGTPRFRTHLDAAAQSAAATVNADCDDEPDGYAKI